MNKGVVPFVAPAGLVLVRIGLQQKPCNLRVAVLGRHKTMVLDDQNKQNLGPAACVEYYPLLLLGRFLRHPGALSLAR